MYRCAGKASRKAATCQQNAEKKKKNAQQLQVNMDANNAGFQILKKSALKIFSEERGAFNTFDRPQGRVLVSNTERRNFVYKESLQGTFHCLFKKIKETK